MRSGAGSESSRLGPARVGRSGLYTFARWDRHAGVAPRSSMRCPSGGGGWHGWVARPSRSRRAISTPPCAWRSTSPASRAARATSRRGTSRSSRRRSAGCTRRRSRRRAPPLRPWRGSSSRSRRRCSPSRSAGVKGSSRACRFARSTTTRSRAGPPARSTAGCCATSRTTGFSSVSRWSRRGRVSPPTSTSWASPGSRSGSDASSRGWCRWTCRCSTAPRWATTSASSAASGDEVRRIPRLHYYYTHTWYQDRDLLGIGHIATTHSVWDLELVRLPVETLLLIYADFRVKESSGPGEGMRIISLAESFATIRDKLENLDREKIRRYRGVYRKLRDLEEYLQFLGVELNPPGFDCPTPARPSCPKELDIVAVLAGRERPDAVALATGRNLTTIRRLLVTAHNLGVMERLRDLPALRALLEEARSFESWRDLRTYLTILGEYAPALSREQKALALRLLHRAARPPRRRHPLPRRQRGRRPACRPRGLLAQGPPRRDRAPARARDARRARPGPRPARPREGGVGRRYGGDRARAVRRADRAAAPPPPGRARPPPPGVGADQGQLRGPARRPAAARRAVRLRGAGGVPGARFGAGPAGARRVRDGVV